MLPELDWDDTERTLVRDESAPPVPAQRTIPLAEREVPKAAPFDGSGPKAPEQSWKKSTVRIVEAAPSDRAVTQVDAAPSTEQVPAVWDDDTENTDFERIVDEAPPSDRRALERVLGKKKGTKTQPIAKRDSIPKRDPNKTKPMRLPIDAKIPDPAPTQPVAVQPDDLDPEDYETIAFERDTKTGELRPVETGVRLKRAGQALDFRRTVVGMAPPSHLLDAIEQAERRIAERRARAAELAQQAKQLATESKPRPKAISVDDSVHVLPVIHVAPPPSGPAAAPEPPKFEPKVIVPQPAQTQAMTAWQQPHAVSPFAVSPSAAPQSEPSPAISSHPPAISSHPPAISSHPPAISSYPAPVAQPNYPSSYPPPAEPIPPTRNWETVQRRWPLEPDFISTAERIQRRSRLRSLVAAVVCLLFVFAAVVVGALMLRGGDGAVVRIHVQSQSGADLPLADIYLDGNKTCEATPCVLRNLEPGTHRVRVEAPGHAPTEQTIAVDKGQDRMLAITVNRHAG